MKIAFQCASIDNDNKHRILNNKYKYKLQVLKYTNRNGTKYTETKILYSVLRFVYVRCYIKNKLLLLLRESMCGEEVFN